MTYATVTGDIHQTFDVHGYLRTQLSFYFELGIDDVTDFTLLIIVPLYNFFVAIHTRFIQDIARSAQTDSKNVSKTDFSSFVFRKINTSYTSHLS
mgnify:CR=1 FL=1